MATGGDHTAAVTASGQLCCFGRKVRSISYSWVSTEYPILMDFTRYLAEIFESFLCQCEPGRHGHRRRAGSAPTRAISCSQSMSSASVSLAGMGFGSRQIGLLRYAQTFSAVGVTAGALSLAGMGVGGRQARQVLQTALTRTRSGARSMPRPSRR